MLIVERAIEEVLEDKSDIVNEGNVSWPSWELSWQNLRTADGKIVSKLREKISEMVKVETNSQDFQFY